MGIVNRGMMAALALMLWTAVSAWAAEPVNPGGRAAPPPPAASKVVEDLLKETPYDWKKTGEGTYSISLEGEDLEIVIQDLAADDIKDSNGANARYAWVWCKLTPAFPKGFQPSEEMLQRLAVRNDELRFGSISWGSLGEKENKKEFIFLNYYFFLRGADKAMLKDYIHMCHVKGVKYGKEFGAFISEKKAPESGRAAPPVK